MKKNKKNKKNKYRGSTRNPDFYVEEGENCNIPKDKIVTVIDYRKNSRNQT